jgi:hypothetical protein
MQPGRDTPDFGLGQLRGKNCEEGLAAVAIECTHPAQVAIVFAAGDEMGEGELVDATAPAVHQPQFLLKRQ